MGAVERKAKFPVAFLNFIYLSAWQDSLCFQLIVMSKKLLIWFSFFSNYSKNLWEYIQMCLRSTLDLLQNNLIHCASPKKEKIMVL